MGPSFLGSWTPSVVSIPSYFGWGLGLLCVYWMVFFGFYCSDDYLFDPFSGVDGCEKDRWFQFLM